MVSPTNKSYNYYSNSLPEELKRTVYRFLTVEDLTALSQVNKTSKKDISPNTDNHVLGALKTKVEVAKENSSSLSEKEKLEFTIDSMNLSHLSLKEIERRQFKSLREDTKKVQVNMGDLLAAMHIQNRVSPQKQLFESFFESMAKQTDGIKMLARSIRE